MTIPAEEPKAPWAKIAVPTEMSPSDARAPPSIYVVAELTTTEPVVPWGPAIVKTSPIIAVTLPTTLAGTISIVLASVGSVELSAMCTLSPMTISASVALCSFFVIVVAVVTSYVEDVPRGSVMVIDVAVMAETSPPMPPGTPGGMGVDDEWFPFAFAATDVKARAVVARVDALATPTSVATTPRAMAEEMLAC
ncbi:MAG TPA: hypothetical protein VII60_00910 [Acidimicrobiales bacterium]